MTTSTHSTYPSLVRVRRDVPAERSKALRFVAPIGRLLFASVFLLAVPGHFSAATIQHAASQGLPLPELVVPLAGIIALLGGLSVALGYRARFGALLLFFFLVPVTVAMHDFWTVLDPEVAQLQRIDFMKNVALLGGALLLAYLGAGPYSLDAASITARSRRCELPT